MSPQAERVRGNRLCPFNNRIPNCTKDKATDPLGVCSIQHGSGVVVTCPVRFTQDWLITADAAEFFFAKGTRWTSLREVKLADRNGGAAGNIDYVLVSYDDRGRITDFGSLEVQAVYISGNVRRPFEAYMEDPEKNQSMEWKGSQANYPKPDFLSSSRKRLVPQMLYKGGIVKSWGKKQAVALQHRFFDTLPALPTVDPDEADIAWMLYDLERNTVTNSYQLISTHIVYTQFLPTLNRITIPEPGSVDDFLSLLQQKLDAELGDTAPDAPILTDVPLI